MMKRLNVLLVSPKSYSDQCDQKLTTRKFLSYSVVYLVNYLKKLDLCDIDYIDLVMDSQELLFDLLEKNSFDLAGFISTAEARFRVIDLMRHARAISPQSKIVVGGSFFSFTADAALKNVPEIDFIVRGEGEATLSELVSAVSQKAEDFSSVAGLSFRSNGRIVHNNDRKPEINPDKFVIDFNLVAKPGYDFLFPMKNWAENENMKAFPLMLGRGCNNNCIFCVHRLAPYRVMKLSSIINQIDWVIDGYRTKYFMFTDPSFCERRRFVEEFCQYLIDNKYHIEWYC